MKSFKEYLAEMVDKASLENQLLKLLSYYHMGDMDSNDLKDDKTAMFAEWAETLVRHLWFGYGNKQKYPEDFKREFPDLVFYSTILNSHLEGMLIFPKWEESIPFLSYKEKTGTKLLYRYVDIDADAFIKPLVEKKAIYKKRPQLKYSSWTTLAPKTGQKPPIDLDFDHNYVLCFAKRQPVYFNVNEFGLTIADLINKHKKDVSLSLRRQAVQRFAKEQEIISKEVDLDFNDLSHVYITPRFGVASLMKKVTLAPGHKYYTAIPRDEFVETYEILDRNKRQKWIDKRFDPI